MSDDRETPESPVPRSFADDDEITGSYILSPEIKPVARRVRKLEKHFEEKGMVYELHSDWTAIKKFVGVFKWLGPMIGGFVVTLVVAIVWLVQHAATQPPPPSAEQVAHEVEKHLQK